MTGFLGEEQQYFNTVCVHSGVSKAPHYLRLAKDRSAISIHQRAICIIIDYLTVALGIEIVMGGLIDSTMLIDNEELPV